MKMPKALLWLGLWTICAGGLAALLAGCACGTKDTSPEVSRSGVTESPSGFLLRTNYHGWPDSIWFSNGKAEVIVVPAAGRIMQFRFAGEAEGAFWENENLQGKTADPETTDWQNFGGDRVWPAPQSHWTDFVGTNWPPPTGFDGSPMVAKTDGWTVILTSPVDRHYGIRVERRIELDPNEPVMYVTTAFEKVEGPTLDVAITVATQLKEPDAIYSPLPLVSRFPQLFNPVTEHRPPTLKVRDGLLSLRRDPKLAHTIGLECGRLLWIGKDHMLMIESPRLPLPLGIYPDSGNNAEISTHPNPLEYVEFEMLAPLHQMRVGDRRQGRSTYRLLRRTEVDPHLDARKLLRP